MEFEISGNEIADRVVHGLSTGDVELGDKLQ
jgi:hypothetical protein